MVDASDATATDADTGDRLGALAKLLPKACHAGSDTDEAPLAELMTDEAASAATAPCAPAGNASLTAAEVDPGAMSTVTAVAPGNCAVIAACTAGVSVAMSGLVNVI